MISGEAKVAGAGLCELGQTGQDSGRVILLLAISERDFQGLVKSQSLALSYFDEQQDFVPRKVTIGVEHTPASFGGQW